MDYSYLFNVVVLGDREVGKTSLVRSFLGRNFEPNYFPTINRQTNQRKISIKKITISLFILDLPGEACPKIFEGELYVNLNLAILMYDVTNRNSFNNIDKWHQLLVNKGWSKALRYKICPVCGQKLPIHWNFCPSCGSPLAVNIMKITDEERSFDSHPIIYLVGNKVDLKNRKVSYEDGWWKAKMIAALSFFEISVKTGKNINKLFHSMIADLLRMRVEELRKEVLTI